MENKVWLPMADTACTKPNTAAEYVAAHLSKIHGLDWHPENEFIFATSSQDNSVRFWDHRQPRKYLNILSCQVPVWKARYTPFSNGLVTVMVPQLRRENSLLLWSALELNNPVHAFVGHDDVVLEFQWRPQKEGSKDYQLVTWSRDQTLRIWRVDPQLQRLCVSDVDDLMEGLTLTTEAEKPLSPEPPHSSGPVSGSTHEKSSRESDSDSSDSDSDSDSDSEAEEETRPPMDVFKAIFSCSSDEKSSSENEEEEKEEPEHITHNLFNIDISALPAPAVATPPSAPINRNTGRSTGLRPRSRSPSPGEKSKKSKDKKNKNKKEHKHKKEKKKKKHKKHKHKGKEKKIRKDESSSESDSDENAAEVCTEELLRRLKTVRSQCPL
uniref:Uncharacterized protein n=1 Tax=Knipowitschia caucasica TaxID=637954 RepID=A0AAV2LVC8_KNICA